MDSVRTTIAFWWEDPKAALVKIRSLRGGGMTHADLKCMEGYLRELEVRKGGRTRGLPADCGAMQPDWQARMLAREGDLDGAFAILQRGRVLGGTLVLYYPEMRAVGEDPRFWPMAARHGLAA